MILNVCVIGNSMKSELLVTERPMIESRKLPHRRNMSKGISIVNGEHVVVDSGSVVRQVNLVAAFHDHISCTKSSEGCEENPSEKMTLPCQTDHIYANCADGKSADDMDLERLRGIVLVHTDLLQHQQEHIFKKDRQLQQLRADRDTVRPSSLSTGLLPLVNFLSVYQVREHGSTSPFIAFIRSVTMSTP